MSNSNVERLLFYANEQYSQFVRGIQESISIDPERFEYIAELYFLWALKARGDDAIERSFDAFVQFTTDVNFAQARYEANGHYENKSFHDVYKKHYSQKSQMDDYLWGVYLTNFLWAHHLEISIFFEDRFLSSLPDAPSIVEIAPGHGGWGVWALHKISNADLLGFDISPSSIEIASSIALAAGVNDRASYHEQDAMNLVDLEVEPKDALICSFLIEHLEDPIKLSQ